MLAKSGLNTVTLTGNNTYTGGTTINGGTLMVGTNTAIGTGVLYVGNSSTFSNNGTVLTFANDIYLSGTSNPTFGGTADMTFTGHMTNTTNANGSLVVTNTGKTTFKSFDLSNNATGRRIAVTTSGGDVVFTGTVADGGTASNGYINKYGAGKLIFQGPVTYGNTTTIFEGTIALGNNDIFTNGIAIGTGATLDIGSYSDTVGNISLSGGSIIGSTGVLTSTAYAFTEGTVSAILGGSATISKTGTTTVTLSGNNTHTGAVSITGGTLAYGANNVLNGNITINGGILDIGSYSDTVNTVTLTSGSINGSGTLTGTSYAVADGTINAILAGTGGLTKTTAGTVNLNSANTYSGATTLTAGTLQVANNLSLIHI